ncbi:glycosyltransferase [Lysobacter sp. LF1]|uniref:Glycosyltransferase n=1 Tax=Lysobacter stagni TaxID=3045172 RepID=A0ABT6XD12_9GAMM|nr:glycosyltransferase [Lysobacter sp. LF1]MDI9237813.1 glycosyltransferase [Lysobacter sp. LF1]
MPIPNARLPTARLLTRDNGAGLSRDLRLLDDALSSQGVATESIGFSDTRRRSLAFEAGLWRRRLLHGPVDVQVSIERIHPRLLALARRNVLLPNPEWTRAEWRALLPRFDRVWCKTRHAQTTFAALGCRTRYIGFTSEDRLRADIPRENAFLHVAGASRMKGTQAVLEAWARNPHWPRLTVVQHPAVASARVQAANVGHRIGRLDDAQLRHLQNTHRFHLCPSQTEGFGHSLMEAMSVGAVVLATDAEPMNELVDGTRGVPIASRPAEMMGLARCHVVDAASIERAVESALMMSESRWHELGAAARIFFESHRRAFHLRLRDAMDELSPDTVAAPAEQLAEWR